MNRHHKPSLIRDVYHANAKWRDVKHKEGEGSKKHKPKEKK